MAKEIRLGGAKKDKYPSKTTINFYIKEDKTTGFSTAFLYLLFAAVLILAFAKIMVIDLAMDLNREKSAYEKNVASLESVKEALVNYNEVNAEYNRFSYNYLTETDKVQDRMDVLDMLEETLFSYSNVESVVISDNVVSATLTDIDLEETSELAKKLEGYDMVKSVSVNTASFGGAYTSSMVIELYAEGEAKGGTE